MIDAVDSLSSLAGTGATRAAERIATAAQAAPVAPSSATSMPDFGAVLSDVASQGVNALREAEAASLAGINGKASVQQVVEAVMNAERTLQTAVAVRDKVVQAYQEISRMQI
ncbi:flagellar hook-basal body complex protein FliE [Salinarimonas ramus]|uniref:Flagellar hook-basal body complex protein FliE n=1 Tax=Salinarimonas ramus TaxID=690164 RepID=A0A917Q7K2_9HYPH|nr:flagellar hook-basal body complex protein FliE [Salinarimonas ramus]GGK34344.1 flagellar hook-basal body complex protein FliE [Salinarimonas ramus]